MDRSMRRHHEARKKERMRRMTMLWGVNPDAATIGKVAAAPKSCSCWMCGNPRKWMKGRARLTMQEQREMSR